jgi:hypothetical protein
MNRRVLLPSIAVLLVASACGAATGSAPSRGPVSTVDASRLDPSVAGPAVSSFPDGASALDDPLQEAFPDSLVDPRDLVGAGLPPDGIPSIDNPQFLDVVTNLEILPPNEPVVTLEIDGDARAYPVRVLVWHEIINDTVGDVPVVITYCPLCNSAVAFDRRVGGAPTTFGTSGKLYNSALVMYDRATESLWTHFDGRSVIGLLAGTQLNEIASPLLAWSDFRAAYPTGLVMDWTRTGYVRDYGRSPYAGYDDPDSFPDLFRGDVDIRAAAMRRVVGISVSGSSLAYPLDLLQSGPGSVAEVDVGGQDLVIFWKGGQASALDDRTLAAGRDVGSVGVFVPDVDGKTLSFAYDGDAFLDEQTGSRWSVTGDAFAGPLAGRQLERVAHLDTFWFAWAAYEPGTVLVEG